MADEATSTTDETATEEHEAPASTTSTEKTTTEEKPSPGKTYDEAYVKGLRQESAGYRTRLREIEAENAALKAERDGISEKASGSESRLSDLERENARLSVALDSGLPKELVPRLVGNTPEELAADAEKLLAFVNPSGSTTRPPNFDGGNRQHLKAPDLATQIAEAEKAGDVKTSMALKARMALENRAAHGPNGAMSTMPPRT